jgi:regulatory protein
MSTDDATAALSSLRAAVARLESGAPTADANAGAPVVDDDGRAPWETGGRAPSWREASREAPELTADGSPQDEETRAREIVLRYLSQTARTRKQLADRLRAKGIADDVAARVLDRMEQVDLDDDAAYAELLVRSKQGGRGLARRALAHELRTKGVPDDIAAAALEGIDPESERARAAALVAQRVKRLHGLPRDVQVRRLAGLLARKGYPGDLAHSVIRGVLDEEPEHRRD